MNCCWIAPNGDVIQVEWHHHGATANSIMGTTYSSEVAILTLAKQGWLHVGLTEFVGYVRYVDLPDPQAAALFSVMDRITSGLVKQNLVSYIHS